MLSLIIIVGMWLVCLNAAFGPDVRKAIRSWHHERPVTSQINHLELSTEQDKHDALARRYRGLMTEAGGIAAKQALAQTEHELGLPSHRNGCERCREEGRGRIRKYAISRSYACTKCAEEDLIFNDRYWNRGEALNFHGDPGEFWLKRSKWQANRHFRSMDMPCSHYSPVEHRLYNMLDWWLQQDDIDVELLRQEGWKVQ